ncbi:glycoside hydrolase family 31 protein [Pengzhenrongella sp.]|jgi:alpha-glucosidase (family GH31 glycosyl hydrolase)|uniref:glycoside hydrolase family 31 protein n=1 Tax=Pengzhenrongella sp. TaxID=2888820 RepID=UPI002F93B73E
MTLPPTTISAIPGSALVDHLELALLPDELWWGGAVADGQQMPFGASAHRRDLATSQGFLLEGDDTHGCNQSAPLLVSTRGRYIWSEQPFTFAFDGDGTLTVDGSDVAIGQGHGPDSGSLAGAFRAASRRHFPPSGATPAPAMFAAPQYNTWIELPYAPTQDGVLAYVRGLLDAGFPPGVVMIDDRWSPSYGTWRFEPSRFGDPAEMVRQLHAWGCTVMLWLVPFVSPDSDTFRDLRGRGLLVRDADGTPAIREWWNGYSAVLDATNPDAVAWLHGELDALVDVHGVDGFKFDAGDIYDYRAGDLTTGGADPASQCEAWARAGARYPFNEYRACWKMGGQPLAQRLHDKPPIWGAGGLTSLIPESIAQGLIGHAFVCPDMVGGGELSVFDEEGFTLDQELFVRYAQVAALFPMMQFSLSPWRVLDPEHLAAVRDAVRLHQDLVPEILELAEHAAATGEPILRALAYHHPGFEQVSDQFLIGEHLLAAPVLEPGATTRTVVLPPGRWIGPDGTAFEGPASIVLDVDLGSVPWFRRA